MMMIDEAYDVAYISQSAQHGIVWSSRLSASAAQNLDRADLKASSIESQAL